MIVICDFDGTLALGSKSHITAMTPNHKLIQRLRNLHNNLGATIKIVTARGAKAGLTREQKEAKYLHLIETFLETYNVPYDSVSFKKEYGDLYIDDMTIGQHSDFDTLNSTFTGNKIILTEKTVIKKTTGSLFEFEWYKQAARVCNVPEVLFCNDETIITQRIFPAGKVTAKQMIELLDLFAGHQIENSPIETYWNNIPHIEHMTQHASECMANMIGVAPLPTFFHGDLSTTNVLVNDKVWLIDSNYKNIYGNYMTDAGKAFFSFVAYEHDYASAKQIENHLGKDVLYYAVAEGLRVCKYKPNYISIVNNIADLI